MRIKILWLSVLGLTLARRVPDPIDEYEKAISSIEFKQRQSRSIWPFTSWQTTTEIPVDTQDDNRWFIQGETQLPPGIDLAKYPVWKIHKYNGIDLKPVNMQPENVYIPEIIEGYPPSSSFPSNYPQENHQVQYQDFSPSAGQSADLHSQSLHVPYSAGYQPAYSPSPVPTETHQSGEFQSSSFSPGNNQLNVQTQQKYEVYANPQPLQDYQSPANPSPQEVPQNPPNSHQTVNFNYQAYNQGQQGQFYGGAKEPQLQSSDESNPDLSFLDDLGGLAPFLPDPTDASASANEEKLENSQQGFFDNLFSRFRGTTEAPSAADVTTNVDEKPANSGGGFLSSIFGVRDEPESQDANGSQGFYQQEVSDSVPVTPTTYYLPKTRGSYVAVKLPPNVVSNMASSVSPYEDLPHIDFHQVPSVPFTEHEIPHIPSPTLDSRHPYNLGYSEVRNSGISAPAINSDYQPSVPQYQGPPPSSRIPTNFNENQGNYNQQSHQGQPVNFVRNNGEEFNGRRVEYFHSSNNGQASNPSIALGHSSSGSQYYPGNQNSQEPQYSGLRDIQSTVTAALSESDSPTRDADNNQSFDTTDSNNFQTPASPPPRVQHTFNFNQQSVPLRQNKPISAPQVSGGFLPSLEFKPPLEENLNQASFNDDDSQNTGQRVTNTEPSRGVLPPNQEFQPPREFTPGQSPVPLYQNLNSVLRNENDVQLPSESYEILPVKDADNFQQIYSEQENNEDARFIQNLNALTSYGTPTNSYQLTSRVPASSNVRIITVPAPAKDETNQNESVSEDNNKDDNNDDNLNKDVARSTSPEQPTTRKNGRLFRKVTKRRTLVQNSNNTRRSAPERQAPTEETDTPLIIRSENDSIPETVRDDRQYHGTEVIDGYSMVHHKDHRVPEDNTSDAKTVNAVLEVV